MGTGAALKLFYNARKWMQNASRSLLDSSSRGCMVIGQRVKYPHSAEWRVLEWKYSGKGWTGWALDCILSHVTLHQLLIFCRCSGLLQCALVKLPPLVVISWLYQMAVNLKTIYLLSEFWMNATVVNSPRLHIKKVLNAWHTKKLLRAQNDNIGQTV